MKKTIDASLKQALCNRGFFWGVIGVIFVLLVSSVQDILSAFRAEELLANGFHDTMMLEALASDGMTLALPILAALPFTSSFVDDVKSGFVKVYLSRTTTKRYITGKIAACAVSGGLVLAVGIFAAYVLAALMFSPMEAAHQSVPQRHFVAAVGGSGAPQGHFVAAVGGSGACFGELMGRVLLFFCSGAFWSMIGMTFAALTGSKYMAYASPFVLYYILIILCERYCKGIYVLYPKEWLSPSAAWMWGNTGVVLLLLELTILVSLGFYATAKKRLKNT